LKWNCEGKCWNLGFKSFSTIQVNDKRCGVFRPREPITIWRANKNLSARTKCCEPKRSYLKSVVNYLKVWKYHLPGSYTQDMTSIGVNRDSNRSAKCKRLKLKHEKKICMEYLIYGFLLELDLCMVEIIHNIFTTISICCFIVLTARAFL